MVKVNYILAPIEMMRIHEELNPHIGIASIILSDGGLLEIVFYSTTIIYILKK